MNKPDIVRLLQALASALTPDRAEELLAEIALNNARTSRSFALGECELEVDIAFRLRGRDGHALDLSALRADDFLELALSATANAGKAIGSHPSVYGDASPCTATCETRDRAQLDSSIAIGDS